MKLLFVLFWLLVQTRASCHTADIINAIGGTTFTVDRITATHAATTTDPYLVIAGKYTKDDTEFGFIYLYDVNGCKVKQTFEFPNVNQGFYDVSFTTGTIIAIGYHTSTGSTNEVIVIGSIEDFLTRPSKTNLNSPVMMRSPAPANITDYVLSQGAFIDKQKTVVVASSRMIRLYST